MINKIKLVLQSYKISNTEMPTVNHPSMVQEDTNSVKARVRNIFESQREQMNARAKVAHSCNDPIGCNKSSCFIEVPDKIVKTSTFKIPKSKRTNLSMLKED